jgi:hypothetical protein
MQGAEEDFADARVLQQEARGFVGLESVGFVLDLVEERDEGGTIRDVLEAASIMSEDARHEVRGDGCTLSHPAQLHHSLRAVDARGVERLAEDVGPDQIDDVGSFRWDDRLVRGGRFERAHPAPVRLQEYGVHIRAGGEFRHQRGRDAIGFLPVPVSLRRGDEALPVLVQPEAKSI